jgi:SAGA-associated factor 73
MDSSDISDNLEANREPARVLRPKAPVDIEKQCAVTLASGNQCARGLTCTRHGMSAKRAVPGRSAPFDQLLPGYQYEN